VLQLDVHACTYVRTIQRGRAYGCPDGASCTATTVRVPAGRRAWAPQAGLVDLSSHRSLHAAAAGRSRGSVVWTARAGGRAAAARAGRDGGQARAPASSIRHRDVQSGAARVRARSVGRGVSAPTGPTRPQCKPAPICFACEDVRRPNHVRSTCFDRTTLYIIRVEIYIPSA